MFCAECSRPVDPRTGHCATCGVWSLDDTSTQAAHTAAPSFTSAAPSGAPWAPPQAAPGFDLPPSYATAAPPAPPSAPAASSTYWPPPRASEREDLPAPPGEAFAQQPFIIPPPPAFTAAPAPAPAPAAAPAPEPDIDVTMFVPRRPKTSYWTIDLPDGRVEVIAGSVIVGRLATPLEGRAGARLLSIDDPTRSVSKNHAIFSDEDGVLFVEDLDSMNGIVVTRTDGHVTDLIPGKRLRLDHGSTVELGDVLLTAHRN